jgi:hypothetical protein
MKRNLTAFVLCTLATCTGARAQGCEALKASIDAKLSRKGVEHYTLEVVPATEERPGRVVGRCGGGTRKLVYLRATGA